MLNKKTKLIIKKIIRLSLAPFIIIEYCNFFKKTNNRFKVSLLDIYPCIKDKTVETGFDRHYIYHTAWAARKVAYIKPEFHIDISSSLYFSGIISAFVPVKFFDYRPADLRLENFTSEYIDLRNLSFDSGSVRNISCMHVVEHIGLGRYGDKIDPDADIKAIKELKRVLAPGGNLLFVVPIGQPKIMFNAHRIYSYKQILEYFSDLNLKEFSLIPEKNGQIIYNAIEEAADKEEYGCGCFWFTKK